MHPSVRKHEAGAGQSWHQTFSLSAGTVGQLLWCGQQRHDENDTTMVLCHRQVPSSSSGFQQQQFAKTAHNHKPMTICLVLWEKHASRVRTVAPSKFFANLQVDSCPWQAASGRTWLPNLGGVYLWLRKSWGIPKSPSVSILILYSLELSGGTPILGHLHFHNHWNLFVKIWFGITSNTMYVDKLDLLTRNWTETSKS